MELGPTSILLYMKHNGAIPFSEWVDGLKDRMARAKIRTRIARLRSGHLGAHRSLGGPLLELKIDYGPGYRVYAARTGSTVVLLLCGGNKGTQSADIARARGFWNDYLERQQET